MIIVIVYQSYVISQKTLNKIVKVAYIREPLPDVRPGTSWQQGAVCPLSDGRWGKVKGNFCECIEAL